jgi:hypothetical protein
MTTGHTTDNKGLLPSHFYRQGYLSNIIEVYHFSRLDWSLPPLAACCLPPLLHRRLQVELRPARDR